MCNASGLVKLTLIGLSRFPKKWEMSQLSMLTRVFLIGENAILCISEIWKIAILCLGVVSEFARYLKSFSEFNRVSLVERKASENCFCFQHKNNRSGGSWPITITEANKISFNPLNP